uniref:Uncharacterized protein n=1 Tax=Amazona collaria TaxID=241587 RepID=A0A8B9EWS4_9PSIT
ASLAHRYEEIQRAQDELGASVAKAAEEARRALTAVQQANADMAKQLLRVSALGQVNSIHTEAPARIPIPLGSAASRARRLLSLSTDIPDPTADAAGADTSQSISGHSSALTMLALGSKGRKGQFGDGRVVPAGMRKVLGHRKGQAALHRRMALVQGRTMVEAQRKIKQAEKTLGNSFSISTTAQRTAGEAERVAGESAKRAQAVLQESKHARKHASRLAVRANETQRELSRQENVAEKLGRDLEEAHQVSWAPSGRASVPSSLPLIPVLSLCPGNLEPAVPVDAVLSAGRLRLQQLRLRVAAPGALAGQLSLLQQEAARQQEKIQAVESDLAEIRADKQNLEDILRSLPEGCSQW